VNRLADGFMLSLNRVGEMKSWKNILPYLLLNVLISAATVLIVLYFWDNRQPQAHTAPQDTAAVPTARPSAAQTPEADAEPSLEIQGVFGVGDLQVEHVLIRNASDISLNLAGWTLTGPGASYTFPNLTLNPNGAVRLYTRSGTDSVIELYWNGTQAQWHSADILNLVDQNGRQRGSFTVP
jgi:hypothetical protein